ncbi:MAG: M23 family metallopeptidase, partial [Myxococcota bacterium]
GLGTRAAARVLLRQRPDELWVEAAPGEVEAFHWPVDGGRFGRGFGYTRRVRTDLIHRGVDIGAPEGATVRAVADGIVAYSDNGIRGFGNCVIIVHPNGWVSLYAHNQRNTVQPGWRVEKGERIGFVGATGIARGPHLHFELRVGGRAVDPMGYFRRPERRPAPPVAQAVEAPATNPSEATPALRMRDIMRRRLPAEVSERAGRVFRTVLWPVRGGSRADLNRRRLRIEAEDGAAVRATADGVVLFVGRHRGQLTIALGHADGSASLYRNVADPAVAVGVQVRRGEWIGKVQGALKLERWQEGRPRPLAGTLVQAPDGLLP